MNEDGLMKALPRIDVRCLSFVLGVPTPHNPQTPLPLPQKYLRGAAGSRPYIRFAVPKKSAPSKAQLDFLTAARNVICFIRHRRRKSRFPQTPSYPSLSRS